MTRPTSHKNTQNLDGISHSNILEVFEVCLELPRDSKDQFRVVVGKFSELGIMGSSKLATLYHAQAQKICQLQNQKLT